MTEIILCGCGGRMGKAVAEAAIGDYSIVAGVDVNATAVAAASSFPVYEKISDFCTSEGTISELCPVFSFSRGNGSIK